MIFQESGTKVGKLWLFEFQFKVTKVGGQENPKPTERVLKGVLKKKKIPQATYTQEHLNKETKIIQQPGISQDQQYQTSLTENWKQARELINGLQLTHQPVGFAAQLVNCLKLG